MKFHVNKITSVVLVVFASCAIFGGILLQSNQPRSPAEPGRLQTSLPGVMPSLNPGPYQNIEHAAEQSVVRFSSEGNKQDFLKANGLSSADLKEVAKLANTYIVSRSEDQLKPVSAQVSEQQQYTALLTPNDTIYQQWYTDKISAPAAWDISTGSSAIIVADIDTGFALNHEDLVGRWAPGGWDFVHNDNDPSAGTDNPNGDGVSHGTVTAGLIGAASNNSKGVASINWGVRILPLQALDDNGGGTTTDVASAIHYAVDQGAKVINMSLGTASPDPIVKAELDYARDHDVLVVAAAGNCGSPSSYFLNGCSTVGQMVYPANYPQVLAVGATDINDVRASFSSYGSNLDVVAPGSGTIQTTAWSVGNQTSAYTLSISGTSFSSPIVAGLAALYRGYITASSASGTITAITSSADKLSSMTDQNFTNEYGFGRINAAHTLSGASPAPVTPTPPPTSPETTPTPLPEPVQPTHPDGTLVRPAAGPNASHVYLLKDGGAAFATSLAVFQSWGFDFGRVKIATQGDLNLMAAADANPTGSSTPLQFREGALVKGTANTVYVIQNVNGFNNKRSLDSLENFIRLNYSFNDVINIPDSELTPIPEGDPYTASILVHPNGTMVRNPGEATVYYVIDGGRRSMTSGNIFFSHRFKWSDVKKSTPADDQLSILPAVTWFGEGTLVKGSAPTVYAVDLDSSGMNASKRSLGTYDNFVGLDYRFSEVLLVNDSELLSMTDGPTVGATETESTRLSDRALHLN